MNESIWRSLEECAETLRVSQETIKRWGRDNSIARNGRGEFNIVHCYAKKLSQIVDEGDPYYQAKVREMNARADYKETEVMMLQGTLVKASEVQRTWANMLTPIRSKFLALPSKMAMQLSHREAQEIKDALTSEIIAILRDLTQ